jgi:hypothetical protein
VFLCLSYCPYFFVSSVSSSISLLCLIICLSFYPESFLKYFVFSYFLCFYIFRHFLDNEVISTPSNSSTFGKALAWPSNSSMCKRIQDYTLQDDGFSRRKRTRSFGRSCRICIVPSALSGFPRNSSVLSRTNLPSQSATSPGTMTTFDTAATKGSV